MSNIKIACSLFSFGTPYIQGHMRVWRTAYVKLQKSDAKDMR